MDNCCAPQWIDFTDSHSPQIPMEDYFEKEHAIHGHIMELCDSTMTENTQCTSTDNLCINKEIQQDLDIIKNTPVKVISPKYRNKKTVVEETTYDQVLNDAMKKLELCERSCKTRDVLNKSIQEPNVFKTPSMPAVKSSRSVGFRSVPNKHIQPITASKFTKVNRNICTGGSNDTSVYRKKTSVSCFLKKEEIHMKNTLKKLDNPIDELENKKGDEEECSNENEVNKLEKEMIEEKNEKQEEDDVMDVMIEKRNRTLPNKQRATVLTWQNGKRNFNKRRMSNHYISLAEAVSRFQTETPKRFRTRSNKDLADKTSNDTLKPMQKYRMKPTIPVSPALTSKNRTRAVTVLSQEEREMRELEEMKKNRIKANPIPPNVLRGPMRPVSKTIAARKSTTTTTTITTVAGTSSSCSTTQRFEKAPASSAQFKALKAHPDKGSSSSSSVKNTVTKVLVTDPTGIIVEREEITFFGVPNTGFTKGVTRVVPFSFETRNKDLQMKKEQRLKSLQETKASKMKAEFHAKPAPNFTKPSTITSSSAKQQNAKKTSLQPCPFSFDERDKNLPKRKEKLMKQILEEDKRTRIFRANPVPVFKPVMVRGVSKEHIPMKENLTKAEKEYATDRHNNRENEEPNIVAFEKMQESKHTWKMETNKRSVTSLKGKIRESNMVKVTLPLELNTDKRAKERREFDERLKRKEMEEKARHEEENKKWLEHEKQLKTELRKMAEMKAKPMPIYKQLTIVKSMKSLTDPQSPAFASKLRSKQT